MTVATLLAFVFAGIAGAWRLSLPSRLDLAASRDLQSFRNPTIDRLMEGATWLGSGPVILFVVALSALICLGLGRRREAIAVALSYLSMPLNTGLKLLANRPRPDNPIEVLTQTAGSSFPSGHAMGSAAVYGTLAALIWIVTERSILAAVVLAIPIVVGISRVYLGAHWGYDVMAGWAAGALCVAAILAWHRGNASPIPQANEAPPT